MKRIILILFIILASFNFSKTLDEHESKRVFDKSIEIFLKGDYEKYKNDREMKRAFEDMENMSEFLEYSRAFVKNNKYEVISVNEEKNKSILKVRVSYSSYKKISPIEYGEASENAILELEKENKELTDSVLSDKVHEKLKNKIKQEEKIIMVYMDKKEGFWGMEENQGNQEFLSIFLSYMGLENNC